jgi:hypothetical protein
MRDAELYRRVKEESDTILESHDCRQMHTTFAAFGPDLRPLELSAERLFVELVKGSQYLFERDPRVLTWMADYQKPHFQWPEYPIAGTP